MKRLNTALDSMMVLFVLCVVVWVLALGYANESDEESAAVASREYVAQVKCGHEAAYKWNGDELTCYTHRGHIASRQMVGSIQQ